MSGGLGPQRVVVTGLGQLAPHGRDVPAAFEALLNGRSALACHEVGEAPHSVRLADEAFRFVVPKGVDLIESP